MFTPNGVIHGAWWPTSVTSETEFPARRHPLPLEPYRDRLLIMRGVENQRREIADDGWPTPRRGSVGSTLVEGFSPGHSSTVAGLRRGGPTASASTSALPHVIGATTPLKSLELGVRALENDVQGRISYAGAGQPLPPHEPAARRVQPPGPGARLQRHSARRSGARAAAERARRRLLASSTCSGRRVGAEDRAKLEGTSSSCAISSAACRRAATASAPSRRSRRCSTRRARSTCRPSPSSRSTCCALFVRVRPHTEWVRSRSGPR